MIEFEPTRDYDKVFVEGNLHKDQKPTPKHTNQFIKIAFNNVEDYEWRINNRYPLSGYLYIATKVYRKKSSADSYGLYHKYFLDNRIAAVCPVRELAREFGYGTNTTPVRRWIKKLKAEGAFLIEHLHVGKPNPANVYILGDRKGKKEYLFYGNLRGV